MQLNDVLTKYNFPPEVKDLFHKAKLITLYPPQAEAVEKGVLEGKNLLLSVPTAAGKTLIAELVMLKAILEKGGRCLYIVPLKALASEKFHDFKEKYTPLGIRVGMATGDLDTSNQVLSRYQILIATAEKVDSLLRARSPWLIKSLNVIVLDEIHFINDESRGPTLEILTARVKQLNPEAQILALSATVSNAEAMAKWLNAELVKSNWRPIPLREGVYFNSQIKFQSGPTRVVSEETPDDLSKLAVDTLRAKGQALIFVNSRRSAQAVSKDIGASVSLTLKEEERKQLAELSKEVIGSASDSTKICRTLGEVVRHGVAFHHAGLKPKQRKLIEDHFKKNLIKVICSTPTLAAGVNLPARRAIIRDYKRFESGLGSAHIPVSEYKQCAGRAGRPQYDESGEAVLMAKSASEVKTLFDHYINAEAEPIVSKLGNEAALRIHILSSIAGEYVHDINETLQFLSHTFLAHQKKTSNLLEMIGDTFEFLEKEGFIEKNGFRYYATAFGQCTSRLYIDPASSIIIRAGLNLINEGKSFSSVGLLHLICCCPDSPILNLGKKDLEEIERFAGSVEDELLLTPDTLPILKDFMLAMSIMKTTILLARWLDEEKEELLCDDFGIGPGDIYRHTETTQWLLSAATAFAELFNFKKITFPLEMLRNRVQYGIKEELIELTSLKGVGRVRGRVLFENGYKKLTDLKHVSIEDLAKIPSIGKALAKDILDQISGKSYKKEIADLASEGLGWE